MNPNYADAFNNNHYVLDLTNFTTTKDAANLKWQEVEPPANQFDLEARADFGHVKVSDNSYIVFGGAGAEKTYAASPNLRNLTTIYFADQNRWQTIPSSQSPANSILTQQGFGAQATMDPNGTVWLMGGIPPSPQANTFNLNYTLLKIEKQNDQWTEIRASPMSNPEDFKTVFNPSFHHGSVYMRDGYIYSYGGIAIKYSFNGYKNNYDESDGLFKLDSSDYAMYEYLVYNTSGNNTMYYNYGYTYPRQRELHTLTALPNTDTFLMYGGINGNTVMNDYCYSFDTKSKRWSKVVFQSGGPGARFGHSAVAYGSDALFVMFGANANGNMLNDAYVLNVTTYEWTAIPVSNGNGTSNENDSSGSGIGTGVIVGIVIGAIAVVS
ncbi:hypothetical protein BCR42DRAFT_15841 [Absidia repens]|uniref:Galactose oxidase n=1 Tax=Absidia repens TaxID=90262 RepID=A0A1X2J222_9FUNG|nr:hypothetical protein BCR42DRAFT_15841 [Absidia repens]